MSRAVFFVQSPLQLLNAIEAKHHFKLSKNILIIRYNSSELNNSQINQMLSYNDTFGKIIKISVCNKIDYLKIFIILKEFLLYRNEKIFVGDIRSILSYMPLKFIANKKLFLLDDGLPTLNIYKKNKTINIYTFLNINNNSEKRIIVKNDFSYIRTLKNIENKNIEVDKVYFIGAPLVEKGVLSLNIFIARMEAILDFYKKRNIKVVYLPHRAEDLNKLDVLEFDSIIKNTIPIEVMFIESDSLPANIASFYSAALYTLHTLFKNEINITSFYIDKKDLRAKSVKVIGECYEYYSNQFDVIYDY